MSIARKRAKVKKNSRADEKRQKKKKTRQRQKRAKAAKRAKVNTNRKVRPKANVNPKRKAKVSTKRAVKSAKRKHVKRRPAKAAKPAKSKKKKRRARGKRLAAIIEKARLSLEAAAEEAGLSVAGMRALLLGESDQAVEDVEFLQRPDVQRQIRERIVEKGLAELTRGMVRTEESIIMASLIAAEQLGNLDQRAAELAAEFDWDIQDIYELWHSPGNFYT